MKIKIYPGDIKKDSIISIPPSKSIAHRCIISASLAEGISIIENIDLNDDIITTIDAMRKLNAKIDISANKLIIEGIGNNINLKECGLNCRMSGSTIRFTIPLFATTNKNITFTGEKNLFKRPFDEYEKIFAEQKLMFKKTDDYIHIKGELKPAKFKLKGNISSQYISGLMFALPLLDGDSIINIIDSFESKPYVYMTISILKKFGINIESLNENQFYIKGNQKYQACDYKVEGDYSQFAFFAALGAINNDLKCINMSHESIQGDSQIVSILRKLNIKIDETENGYKIQKSRIKSAKIDVKDIIDLAIPLCILGMFSQGEVLLYNAERLKYKESNRLLAICNELEKIHVDITHTDSTIHIIGNDMYYCDEELSSHNDHRIVMCLAIIATKLEYPVIIDNFEEVNKSYPNFFETLSELGIKTEIIK